MIVITTDVFCNICGNWTFGVTGPRANAHGARRNAKKDGWTRRLVKGKVVDLCPDCKKDVVKG